MSENVEVNSRDLTIVGIAFLLMILTVALLVANLIIVGRQAATANETHQGVCLYRQSLAQEALAGEHYLSLHPDGLPSLHISAAQLQQSIDKERSAVQALSGLDCSAK